MFGGTMTKRATKAEIAIAELVAKFPAAFTLNPTLVRPLKLGIKEEIYAQCAISRRRIKSALRSYCNSAHYLTTSTEGAMRIGLTGEQAGIVNGTEARHATERLAGLAKVAAKRSSMVATSTGALTPKGAGKESPREAIATPKAGNVSNRTLATEPTTAGPKRLSLRDLKRAAAARKSMR
jgi:sRNA-binding protein